ncbi:hypothetical protein BKI52_36495 [marine bacterium AO1-C]|nr:hypothetical protein BKI52_36495 [marine bacterium AO1-C]
MKKLLSYLQRFFRGDSEGLYNDPILQELYRDLVGYHTEPGLEELLKSFKKAEGIDFESQLDKQRILEIFLNTKVTITLLLGTKIVTKLGAVPQNVLRHLILLLEHPNEGIRRSAAQSLYDIGSIEALSAVIAGNNHGRGIRTAACWKLNEFGKAAAPAIPSLFALLRYKDINWRSHWAAAEVLGSIGEIAKPLLIENLDSTDIYLQYYSALALSLLKPTPYLTPEIEKIISDNDGLW